MPTRSQENVLPIEGSSRVIARQDRRVGAILAEQGKLGPGDVERVLQLQLQQRQGARFGEAALRVGLITKEDLQSALAAQYDFPHLLPGAGGIGTEVVVAYEPLHPRAEELRALRAELLIRWSKAEVRHRVLAIVSPGRGEGRSYVAANLAVLFSQLGERTLLIDADLRAPRQQRIFDIPDTIGLSAVLSGRADRSAVVPIPSFSRLSVLPAGAHPPNPQELLSRHVLGDLLQQLRTEFDVILLDTPPAKLYADARIVAFRAGSAMVLARKGHTRLADTTGVIREFDNTGARIVGTVLNAF
jgi:chain length determinant protein tyrosine kinase EpsG